MDNDTESVCLALVDLMLIVTDSGWVSSADDAVGSCAIAGRVMIASKASEEWKV
jgi:hypothetical protein